MQVQHPRGTDVDARSAPSKVSIPGHGNIPVDEDGYLAELEEGAAEHAMSVLADAYDVEYGADGAIVSEEDDPPDEVEAPFDPSDHTVAELSDELADADLSDAELAAIADAERAGDDRTGALDAIESEQEE